MDPHEAWLYYEEMRKRQRIMKPVITAYTKILRHMPDDKPPDAIEQQQDASPRRSNRFVSFFHNHWKKLLGGAAATFIVGLGAKFIRRSNRKP